MAYTAAEVVGAFMDGNESRGYHARSYSKEGKEQVHFKVPSNLISVKYDCFEDVFYIKFEKFHSHWGNYVSAIANSIYHILSKMRAGGLDIPVPDSAEHMWIMCSSADDGVTMVRWEDKF